MGSRGRHKMQMDKGKAENKAYRKNKRKETRGIFIFVGG